MGLAFLAKGPLVLLPVLGVLVLAAARWDPKVLGALPWGWGSLLAAAIGLPWFVLIAREHLPELTHMVLSQVLDRVTTGAGVPPRLAWWYLLVLPANVFPWSLFLPAVVWELSEGSSLAILHRVSHRSRRPALLGPAIAERLDTLPVRGEPPGLRECQPPGQALATVPQGAR